jgi:mono/diheme cytochrome c family protein
MNQPDVPTPAAMVAGKKVYETNCLTCHQKDGDGVPRLNASLVKSKVVLGDKKKLIRVVLLGSEKAGVHNEEYSNPMPAQPQLSNEELAHVLTYVRNSFGNKASAISVTDVKHIRKK